MADARPAIAKRGAFAKAARRGRTYGKIFAVRNAAESGDWMVRQIERKLKIFVDNAAGSSSWTSEPPEVVASPPAQSRRSWPAYASSALASLARMVRSIATMSCWLGESACETAAVLVVVLAVRPAEGAPAGASPFSISWRAPLSV